MPTRKNLTRPKMDHVCVRDCTRLFDCNCGTNDSYCLICEEPMFCPFCADEPLELNEPQESDQDSSDEEESDQDAFKEE